MKIAAVVVTYNRREELKKNIECIFGQSLLIDKYYIIDNHSNDNTFEFLKEQGLLDNEIIEYVYLEKNIGGAGGFYTGVKRAYDDGFDFVCLMDDDGRPADKDMMKNLMAAVKKEYKYNKKIFFNPLVLGFDNDILSFGLTNGIKTLSNALENTENNLIKNTVNPFNGTLISRELIEEIGFPNKDFFIKGDETEYLLRAINAKSSIATVTSSRYNHPILKRIEGSFFGKKVYYSTEEPWKEYYRARNYTYMFSKNGEKKKYIRQNIKQIVAAIKYNDKKIPTIKMIIKGYKDGRSGKLGSIVKP